MDPYVSVVGRKFTLRFFSVRPGFGTLTVKEAGGGFPTGHGVVRCCCSAELAGVQRTTFARNGSCGGSAALSAALSN